MQKILTIFVFCMINGLFLQAQDNTNLFKTWKIPFSQVLENMPSQMQDAYKKLSPTEFEAVKANVERATLEFKSDQTLVQTYSDLSSQTGSWVIQNNKLTVTLAGEVQSYQIIAIETDKLVLLPEGDYLEITYIPAQL